MHDDLANALELALGVRPTELVPTVDGHAGSWFGVVSGTPVVIKVSSLAPVEAWALTEVRRQGVPVPEVLAVGSIDASAVGTPFVVMRRIDGQTMSTRERTSRRLLHETGAMLRRVHEVAGTGFGVPSGDALRSGAVRGVRSTWSDAVTSWVDTFLRTLDGRIDTATADAVRRALDARAPALAACTRSSLLHGDFTPRHVVVARWGRHISGILDFAGAQFGAPAYDLGVFSIASPHVATVAEGYEGDPVARRALLDDVVFYRMVRTLAETAWAQTAGVDFSQRLVLLRNRLRAMGEDVPDAS